jgi:hypothetical protein
MSNLYLMDGCFLGTPFSKANSCNRMKISDFMVNSH